MKKNLLPKQMSILFFLFLMMFISSPASANLIDCAGIKTEQGNVSGVSDAKAAICVYKGIPYAAPPVGNLRWALPAAPALRNGDYTADKFKDECVQKPFSLFGGEGSGYVGGEDCLYLNIWHPASEPKSPRPVMVFVHGGSFMMGAGSWELYDGAQIASQGDVILVTINYRLGPFGLLAHPALRDDKGYEGNYGIHDQIAALKWVKNNIALFGGDPDNITLFGESAGGMSVNVLLLSPLSEGLFQKAIVESGPQIFMGSPLKASEDAAIKIAVKLGCSDLNTSAECLRKADSKAVMDASAEAMTAHGGTVETYDMNPTMDDVVVFTDPYHFFADGKYNKDVDIIVGTNRDEADLTAMTRPLHDRAEYDATVSEDVGWAKKGLNLDLDEKELKARYPFDSYKTPRRAYSAMFTDMVYACPSIIQVWHLAANNSRVYQYQFEKSPDERGILNDMGVFHAAELPFVFGKFSFMGLSMSSPKNLRLSKKVIALWTSFARNGVPKAEGVPEWPPYTAENPAYLKIDVTSTIGKDLRKDNCKYFDAVYQKTYSQ